MIKRAQLLTLGLVLCFVSCGIIDISEKSSMSFNTSFKRIHMLFSSACFKNSDNFNQILCFGKCINNIKGYEFVLEKDYILKNDIFFSQKFGKNMIVLFGGYKNGKISGLFTISMDEVESKPGYYKCFDDYEISGELIW